MNPNKCCRNKIIIPSALIMLLVILFSKLIDGSECHDDVARLIAKDRIITSVLRTYENYLQKHMHSISSDSFAMDKPITHILKQSMDMTKLVIELTGYLKQNLPALPVVDELKIYTNTRQLYIWYAMASAFMFVVIAMLQQHPVRLKNGALVFLPFIIFWLFLAGHLFYLYPQSDKSYYKYITFGLKQFSPPPAHHTLENKPYGFSVPIWSLVHINRDLDFGTLSNNGFTLAVFENLRFGMVENNPQNWLMPKDINGIADDKATDKTLTEKQ